jgi:dTDP-4-dehydrorhamnose 3,5-epimerase
MKVIQDNTLPDVKLIMPYTVEDHRGCFTETYHHENYTNELGITFVQDDYSYSRKHTLRGLHGDYRTWKLVQSLWGEMYLVVMDMREDSPTYKQYSTFDITFNNKVQVLVPPGFINGHLCLSERCIFSYKQSAYYTGVENQLRFRWNDPSLNIWWPIQEPILSRLDETVPLI